MPGKLQAAKEDLGLNFAGVKAPGPDDFDPIPNGTYHFRVERWNETETGENAKEPGTLMYKLAIVVSSGNHENRWVFDQFVMGGKGAEISFGRLKGLMLAVGIPESEIDDDDFDPTEEWANEHLIGEELDAKIGQQKAQNGFDPSNRVLAYMPHEFTEDDLVT